MFHGKFAPGQFWLHFLSTAVSIFNKPGTQRWMFERWCWSPLYLLQTACGDTVFDPHKTGSKFDVHSLLITEERNIVEGADSKSDQRSKTCEGYLHKQGVLLKGWKCRWFVLDFMKHQVCILRTCFLTTSSANIINNMFYILSRLTMAAFVCYKPEYVNVVCKTVAVDWGKHCIFTDYCNDSIC